MTNTMLLSSSTSTFVIPAHLRAAFLSTSVPVTEVLENEDVNSDTNPVTELAIPDFPTANLNTEIINTGTSTTSLVTLEHQSYLP
mgnify:CR=1 FL=1